MVVLRSCSSELHQQLFICDLWPRPPHLTAGVTLWFFSYYSLPFLSSDADALLKHYTCAYRCQQLHLSVHAFPENQTHGHCITSAILFWFDTDGKPSCHSMTQKASSPGMECIWMCDILAGSHEWLMWQGKVIMSASGSNRQTTLIPHGALCWWTIRILSHRLHQVQ